MNREFPHAGQKPHVKVCGIRRAEDARVALDLGASFIGMILTNEGPRYLPRQVAGSLATEIRATHPGARLVGVFRHDSPEEIARLADELDLFAVQIHGNPAPVATLLGESRVIPAIGVENSGDAEKVAAISEGYPMILADAARGGKSGGTGHLFDHAFIQPFFAQRRIAIAGGLRPENFAEVLERIGRNQMPYAFDASSGLESAPGEKSPDKLRTFFRILNDAFDG